MRHGSDKNDTRAGVNKGTGAILDVGGDTSSRVEIRGSVFEGVVATTMSLRVLMLKRVAVS